MDNFKQLIHQDTKYHIIGSNVLQFVLIPNEQIITKDNYIQYYSGNTTIESKRNHFFFQIMSKQSTITNKSKDIGYVGLQAPQSGKIFVVDAAIFMNFHLRESAILAYNSHIDLVKSQPLVGQFKKIIFNQSNISKYQVAFLHSSGVIIDKELGQGETIIVKSNQVIMISDGMKWKYHSQRQDYRNVQLQGPGRVFLEMGQIENLKQTDFKQVQISMYVMTFCLVILSFFTI